MKCPHCGSEMHQEQVFCEKCGRERLLVPVFEPEIEDSVAESMSTIAKALTPDETVSDKQTEQSNIEALEENEKQTDEYRQYKEKHGQKQVHFFVTAIVLLIIVISAFSIYFYLYTGNSYAYQMERAVTAFEEGNYEEALSLADRALLLDETSVDARMLKIEIYQAQGQTDMVIEKCLSLIGMDPVNQKVYDILIPVYIEREEYRRLSQLLADCQIQAVVEKYADYTAAEPEFGSREGNYDTSISLKLIASGTGNIYYTLDGSVPNKYSDRYTAPIKLLSGRYHVSAVYVNNYGVSSPVVSKIYEIQSDVNMNLEISPDSGSYDMPYAINATPVDEDYTIFYTTDDTRPTQDSNIYSTAFPMPLGHSEFRFMMVDSEGNESDIITRVYDCEPVVNYTPDQACLILKQNLIARGELLDVNGRMNGTQDTREYICDSAVTSEQTVYYVIYEYSKSASADTMIRTGNIYAFHVLNGEIMRAAISDNGFLSLSEF